MFRVLEIGQIIAGPAAGSMLSQLGFEVIKVEQPGKGDATRYLTGSSIGNFAFFNMGKKSLTLDLKNAKGKDVFKQLVKKSDVVIDNLAPDTMQKLGLGYDVLSTSNPKLVYLKIKGFGPGPSSWRKSLDYPAEVESGIAYMNGLEDRPMRLGASVIDVFSAAIGVVFVLKALMDRERTNTGFYAEVPLFETAAFIMGQHLASAQVLGKNPRPLNEEPFMWGIYDMFETADAKKIFIGVTTDSQWEDFCRAFKLDELFSNQDLRTNVGRRKNRDWLVPKIGEIVKSMNLREVVKLLATGNIAYGISNKTLDLLTNEQLRYDAKLVNIKNTDGKMLLVPRVPIYVSQETVWPVRISDPPKLGQDTNWVLKDGGYTDSEIEELRQQGVI